MGDCVVIKGKPGGAESQGMDAQIHSSSQEAGFHLRHPVAAVAEASQYRLQVGHEKQDGGGVGRQGLFKSQVAGLLPKIPGLQQIQLVLSGGEKVGATG